MSRITKLGRSQTTGAVRAALDRMAEQRGNVPNMFRIVAHRPELLTTMLAHFAEVMKDTTVPVRLKELLAVQTSLANSCAYWLRSHTALAERFGATPEQIESVLDFENGPYDEREKAALRFGLRMTREAMNMTDEDVAALRVHWSEGEAVEIAAVVGTFNYFNRFNDAFAVEPTKPGEGLES